MASTAAAESPPGGVIGPASCSPLRLAVEPGRKRAGRLAGASAPMPSPGGARGERADLGPIRPACEKFGGRETPNLLDADHGDKILKSSSSIDEDVFAEMHRVARDGVAQQA